VHLGVASAQLDAQAENLAVAEITSIGVLSGDPRLEFGLITGFAVDDEQGVMYIFDRQNLRLSAFTRSGDFLASAGRSGAGPGEFRGAQRIAAPIGRARAVQVVDHINARISLWYFRSGSLALLDELPNLSGLAGPVCTIANDLFFLRFKDGSLLQRVDSTGRVLNGFGRPFLDENPVMAQFTANGRIACHGSSNSVYVAATVIPVVRRYDAASGKLLWESEIPDMTAALILPNPRSAAGLPMYRPPEGRDHWDAVVSVVPAPEGRVLVQIAPAVGSSSLDATDVTTIIFRSSDGSVLGVRADFPRLDFAGDAYAYSHANDPFPRVRVYRWR
jgi:hypothetical protein